MTTINLTLSPELEQRLRTETLKQGLEPDLYILNTFQEHLQPSIPTSQPTEADLLQQINIGFSAQTWEQYHTLIAKRRAETLSPEEHDQLIQLSNRLENLNVARIQALIQLANLRNQTLEDLMQNLGINPDPEVMLLSVEEYNQSIE
jgi:deferrochelatase/peroxidase EfeB